VNDNYSARILYLRQSQWTDWSQLLTAVDTTHPITSMHIIDTNTCKKSKLCSSGSLVVLGDASGRLTVISPSVGILLEIENSSDEHSNSAAEVTALTSFASERGSIVIVAGYSDGTLLWHSLFEEKEQGKIGENKENFLSRSVTSISSFSGSIISETPSSWTVLDAFALHGGKHGVANIAGATADGFIAWGRIYVGSRKKLKNSDINELHWDSLLTASKMNSNSSTSTTSTVTTAPEDGIIATKAHLKAAEFINFRGEVIWSPFLIRKKNQQRHVLRPPRACDNWIKHRTIIGNRGEHRNLSNINDVGSPENIKFSAVAMEAVSLPTSRIFSEVVNANSGGDGSSTTTSSELVSMRTGTASGRPSCHVIARVPLKYDNTKNVKIEAMAVLPGYVVALSSAGELQIYNTSGAFHRPSFATVLKQPLQDLEAEINEKIYNSGSKRSDSGGGASKFWQSWWKNNSKEVFSSKQIKQYKYRIESGASTHFPTASPSPTTTPTTGLVAIQLSPTLVGLYATSLPYSPPRGTPGNMGSTTRVNWLAALQPLVVAAVVGFAMHKARVGKRQAAAQQFFKSRMMERVAGGGGVAGGFRNAIEEDEWDAPFPWEQRVNGRSNSVLRGGATTTATEQTSREYRRNFKIDTGLGGRRSNNRSRSNSTNTRPFRAGVPPPFVDRAPLPKNVMHDKGLGIEEILGNIGSEENSSEYSDGAAIT
jgi:hypothetical protein